MYHLQKISQPYLEVDKTKPVSINEDSILFRLKFPFCHKPRTLGDEFRETVKEIWIVQLTAVQGIKTNLARDLLAKNVYSRICFQSHSTVWSYLTNSYIFDRTYISLLRIVCVRVLYQSANNHQFWIFFFGIPLLKFQDLEWRKYFLQKIVHKGHINIRRKV